MAETKKATPGPILNLDTLVEHQFILIDGQRYDLANAGELSILDYHRVARQGAAVEAMLKQETDLSDEQVGEMTRALDALCKVLLRAPADVIARLSDGQKLQVVTTFTQLQRMDPAAPAGAEAAPTKTSTGESTSPA